MRDWAHGPRLCAVALRYKEENVDFIERIFHFAPDGGTGSLELAILLVLVIFPLAVLMFRKNRARRPSQI
jgi:hypothetical protein